MKSKIEIEDINTEGILTYLSSSIGLFVGIIINSGNFIGVSTLKQRYSRGDSYSKEFGVVLEFHDSRSKIIVIDIKGPGKEWKTLQQKN